MGWLRPRWYYGPKGRRRGPFSHVEIRDLIGMGAITPESRLSEGKEKIDYPAIKTEFSACFPSGAPDAAEETPVPDRWLWLCVFVPLFAAIGLYVLYYAGWQPFTETWGAGVAVMALSAALMGFDCALMARRGYKPPLKAIVYAVLFCYPIYFYYRSRQLRRSQTSTWVSGVCLLLVLSMSYSWPLLTNKEVEEVGARMVNHMLQTLRPEIAVNCTSVSVLRRLPGTKFEITGYLSGGKEMKMTLVQSWQYLEPAMEGEKVILALPLEIADAFMKKYGEAEDAETTRTNQ